MCYSKSKNSLNVILEQDKTATLKNPQLTTHNPQLYSPLEPLTPLEPIELTNSLHLSLSVTAAPAIYLAHQYEDWMEG